MTPHFISGLLKQFNDAAQKSPTPNSESMRLIRNQIKDYRGTICVEIPIAAESKKAQELAYLEAERVLELLRYAIPTLAPNKRYPIVIGIKGEIPVRLREILGVSHDFQGLTYGKRLVRMESSFDVSKDNIKRMKKIGLFELGRIRSKA